MTPQASAAWTATFLTPPGTRFGDIARSTCVSFALAGIFAIAIGARYGALSLAIHAVGVPLGLAAVAVLGGPAFFVGCALNLSAADVDKEIRGLRKKIAAGADFALTQPVYDAAIARAFLQRYALQHGPLPVPILAGVLPLYSTRHATFLHNEVPGISIPDAVRARIAGAANAATEGIAVALELIEALRGTVQGVYLMPPFGRFDLAAEIIEQLRQRA